MARSAQEIILRCTEILHDPIVMGVVLATHSPTAAYDLVWQSTASIPKAKAGRWLAVLRRDFPEQFNEVLAASHQPRHEHDTAQPGA